jgi:hypothetical protein
MSIIVDGALDRTEHLRHLLPFVEQRRLGETAHRDVGARKTDASAGRSRRTIVASQRRQLDGSRRTGATFDEIVGCLIAVAPVVGLARVVSAAPELALALGYDVDAALEATGGEQD